MARTSYFSQISVVLLAILFVRIQCSTPHNASQEQTLLSIQQLLYYPVVLSSWNNATDFCNTVQSSPVIVVCYEDVVTQLHIINSNKAPPLPKDFSIDTLFTTLVSLPSLKVLTLVSLGLWGKLPTTISNLSSLEILNLTSNHFYGSVPPEITSLTDLQSLVLDDNKFTGWIPNRVGFLSRLSVLSMKNNSLNGFLPKSVGSLVNLRVLILSHNNFTGQVPDLSSLTNLQVLEIEDNLLGPSFPRVTNRIISIVLRDNKFTAGLPKEIHSFYQLRKLDIALNRFVGPFPTSILSLPSITYLDIEGNKFTGMLFDYLSCNPKLQFVDLSANLLTGKLPSCLVSSMTRNVVYEGNCLTVNDVKVKSQNPISFCRNQALAVGVIPRPHMPSKKSNVGLIFGITGGVLGGIVLVGVAFFVFRHVYGKKMVKKPPPRVIAENGTGSYTSKLLSDARYVTRIMKLGSLGIPAYRTFLLEELQEATNGFDTSTFMGEGSHGQMYKGQLNNGPYIAIQCLKMKRNHSTQTFTSHIELISKLRHQHLVSALGHCFEFYLDDSSVSRLFLVFEYVPNGTLRDWISGEYNGRTLSWSQRIAAAIGIVKGIQFLHTGIVPRLFSSNLKITDVLLDQNFVAKISCYNLTLLTEKIKKQDSGQSYFSQSKEPNRARMNNPEKVDVYDFGIILLEILVGKPLYTQKEVESVKEQFQSRMTHDDASIKNMIDPSVQNTCSDQSLTTMAEMCSRCLVNDPAERPSVEDMLWNLQFAAQVQDAWHSSEVSPVSYSQPAIRQK
nr:probable inactive leucine-rich repeat receptor-like protein kinase At3g03770 [Tanacetum cinerariifolium]